MNDIDCTPEQKLKGTISLLRDVAYQWWLSVEEGTQSDCLNWDFFKTAFQGKNVGASYVDTRRYEFMNLTQGDRYVAEYEVEFLRLGRYAQGMVASEYEKCVCFENGLRDSLKVLIAPQREREFAVLVDKVKIAEEVKRVERQNRDRERGKNKWDSEPSSSVQRPQKWARPNGPVRVGFLLLLLGFSHVVTVVGLIRANVGGGCGQRALGRGTSQTEARQPAIFYATQRREDRDTPDVIMGTFSIFDVPYTAFIDIGSTYSYVGSIVSENLRISVESTSKVQWVVFLENLMELPFGEFDLILYMDWLVEHRFDLDCATKRVVLRTEDDKEVVAIGKRRDYMFNVISALVAKKLVQKGCEVYLAYVSISISWDSSIRDIRKVRDFLKVIPKELSGLPLNREVEFGIELLPGIALVFIAPYHMASKELTKLKAQLQELLDRRFICPSVSL
ncbi:uncharacterized protein LOC105775438 [Gossypium raimondii]|uniref:uncharacterized protein LOC105775438 n=1 Tax=Gossypium raimondii TaxID=29730 RepID=UPI00227B0BCF|nr:uncharacterized protein LOC105775438 [Gossypium raimondii]